MRASNVPGRSVVPSGGVVLTPSRCGFTAAVPARGLILAVLAAILLAGAANGAVLRVTSNADSGPGTLRAAITTAEANGQTDIILITTPGPIVLASQLPAINTDMVILGSGQTVSGNHLVRIFRVNGGNVTISNLTLSNGSNIGDAGGDTPPAKATGGAGGGGAGIGAALLVMGGTVIVEGVAFSGNGATGGRGGRRTIAGDATPYPGGGGAGGGAAGGGSSGNGGNTNGWSAGGHGGGANNPMVGGDGGDFSGGGGGGIDELPGDAARPSVTCTGAFHGGAGGFGGGGGGGAGISADAVTGLEVCATSPSPGCCPGGAAGLHGAPGGYGAGFPSSIVTIRSLGIVTPFLGVNPGFNNRGGGGAGLGGAIFVNSGTLTVTDSSFSGNTVVGGSGGGQAVAHAIFNRNGTVDTGNVTYDNTTNHISTSPPDGVVGATATAPHTTLALSVTDGLTLALPGQAITYTLTVDNSGPDAVPVAAVTDTFPAALVGVIWTCAASGTATCAPSGSGNLDDSVTLPAGGELVYTIQATISTSFDGTLANTATVTASGDGATATDTTHVVGPNLSIAKAHSGSFTQGSTATWTLQVTNIASNPSDSTNGSTVTVIDTLPAGYTLSSGTGTGWTCGSVTNVVTCTSSDVVNASGGMFPLITLSVNVPPDSPPSVSNAASVFGGGDALHANAGTAVVSNSDGVTVIQVPASITINGSATQTALAGTPFGSLAVTVKDAGNLAIPNYSSVVFTAPATGPGGTFDTTTNTKSVATNGSGVADPGTLTANTTAGTFAVDVAAGPAIHAMFNLTNTQPDLTLTKVNSVSGTTTNGSSWNWTLHVANAGTAPANFTTPQVIVLDNLPGTNIGYGAASVLNPTPGVSGTISCSITSNDLTCAAGSAVVIGIGDSFDVQFTATATAVGTVTNPRGGGTAAVDPGNVVVESNESNNSANDSVFVTRGATMTAAANQTATFGSGGQSVMLSATVTNPSITVNEGTVTFAVFQGATLIGSPVTSSTVSGGGASAAWALPGNTATGTYSIQATYNPASNFSGSVDIAHTLIVNPAGTSTVAASQIATFGSTNQNVSLSAVVSATSGVGAVNEGTVTFAVFRGATPIGSPVTSATVINGNASAIFALPGNTSAGPYSIVATYNAVADYTGSTDNTHSLNVSQAGTASATSDRTATFGSSNQNVHLSASVTATGGAGSVNVGTVTFSVFNGPTQIGSPVTSPTVSGGSGSANYLLPANTPAGSYSIHAVYTPSPDYIGSLDIAHSLVVTQAGTTTTAADETATFGSNDQDVTLSAIVNTTGGSGSVNEGTVTFALFNGLTEIGNSATSATVSAGVAIATYLLPANTPAGSYSIHATYNPGPDYTGSSDNTHILTANQSATTIAAGNQTAVLNASDQNVLLSATVMGPTGFVNEGTVTFALFQGPTPIGSPATSGTVIGGSAFATFVLPGGTARGIYTIVATYNPSADYLASSDNTHTLTVTAPDLTLTKTDNVGGATTLGNSWTWTLHVANAGDGLAVFADTNAIVIDNLPNANITYGSASVANQAAAVTGTIACNIAGSDLTCIASGPVTMNPGGSFDIQFTAMPGAIGAFVNPRTAGSASADPANVIAESDETNNTASDVVTVTAPDLTLAKTNDVSGATTLGNHWTWTLTAANLGNAAAIFTPGQPILTDNLPGSNIGYGTASVTNETNIAGTGAIHCSMDGNDLTCSPSGGSVIIGASGSFKVSVTATPSAIGTFTNPRGGGSAAVDPANVIVESSEGNNTASDTVVVTAPDLTLTKSNNASNAEVVGIPWTWTLHVANIGNAAATWSNGQSIILDNLPNTGLVYGAPSANVAGVACGINGTFDLTCSAIGTFSIPANGSFDVQFTATPSAANPYANPRLGGTAMVDPNNNVAESNESNNTASDLVTVFSGADLAMTKSGPGTAVAGDPAGFDYTLTVVNNGPLTSTGGFTVTDTLPDGLTFQAGTSDANCGAAGQLVTCTTTSSLANGGARKNFIVHVTLASSATGTLSSRASVVSSSLPDPNTLNNLSAPPVTTIVLTQADLSITKSAPLTVTAGSAFDYTIAVTNNGPSDNTGGFTVTDTLPAGTTFQPSGSDASCSAAGQNVTCTIGTGLISAATRPVTIHVTAASSVTSGTVLNNTASVSSNATTDPNNANDTSTPAATTTVQTAADLSITKSAPATTIAGDPLGMIYTITVTNNGPSDNLGGYTVTDVLPSGTTFDAASDAGCVANIQTVTCTEPALVSGASQPIVILVTVASTVANNTVLINAASLTSNGTTDPTSGNDTSSPASTTVQTQADLSITESGPATATAGSASGVSYAFTINNDGPSANTGGFRVTDALPAGLTFQSSGSDAGCSAAGQTVTCTNGVALAAGAQRLVTIHATLSAATLDGTVLHNNATVSSIGTSDPNAANDSSNPFDTSVQASADLSVSKTAAAGVIAGNPLTYTITVANNGPSDAQKVSLSDVLPSDAVFATQSQTAGGSFNLANSGQTVTDTMATLAAGATATFSISTNVKASPSATTFANAANVSTSTADPVPANNASTATTSIAVAPVVTTQPNAQTVCESQSATFTAAASGTPAPTVQWQVSTNNGATFSNISGATSATLTFATAAAQNGNQYRALFTNIAATVMTNAVTLTVNTLPVVTAAPSTQSACESSSVTFTAAAIGSPLPTVQWQVSIDGGTSYANISGATATSYTHTAAVIEDGNRYRAVFTNLCGTATTAAAILTVTTKPVVTSQPMGQAVCAGTPVTLSVGATGTSLSYQWRKNLVPMAGATSSILAIAAVAPADAGSYDAVVTGACQPAAVSQAAILIVTSLMPPPVISGPSSVKSGADLVLTATAGFGSYQWLLNGTAIPGAATGVYHLTSFGANNAGNYTVLATSGNCAPALSAPFRVDVEADVPTPENPIEQILAVIGSTPGANGSQFMTSLQMNNPGDVPIEGTFQFFVTAANKVQTSTHTSVDFTLAPHETRNYPDILGLGGFTGLATASLISRSGGVPVSVLHVFNDQGTNGTAGMIERPIAMRNVLAVGDGAVLIAPADPVATRVNIGVRALIMGLGVHVTVRGRDGTVRTTFDRTFSASQFTQETASIMTGLPAGPSDSITFDVTSGSGVVYAASTDNATNDPNIQFATRLAALPALPPGAGTRALLRSIIPVAGSTAGAFGSHFKTALQLYNAGGISMGGSIVFHPSGRSGADDDPALPISIAPQATLTFDDVLASMTLSGVGSIDLFTGGTYVPVAVTRVYNDAGAGGQTSLTEELIAPEQAIAAGQQATILAPHDPVRARFNIGVRTLEAGATIKATVRAASGVILRTTTLNYPSTWFEQVSATQQLGITFTGDESITYEVQSGAAILYGVWTDNITQDPSLQFALSP